jgi:glycosyltransferase involved in cell wall biosynthesis
MSGPRVSIVMPVYNAGDYLTRALDSVAAQTFRDFELVVVDDGSTDARTRAVLDAAAGRAGDVFGCAATTLHRTENRGPARARNLAVERARGAYVLPLDADDWLAPEYLARTVPVLDAAAPRVGVVYTWIGLAGAHHGVWRTGGFTLAELLARCTIHVCSLYRRELWTEVGGYDPAFVESCEDWDFWLGAVARGWEGACVPEVLAWYRRTDRSRHKAARVPGVSGKLVRTLVEKHRALYDAHLVEAVVRMYEEREATNLMLERLYDRPAMRLFGRVRALLQLGPRALRGGPRGRDRDGAGG